MNRSTCFVFALVGCLACTPTPIFRDSGPDGMDAALPDSGTPEADGEAVLPDASDECRGCMGDSDECLPGDANDACGVGGTTCSQCAGAEVCADGACVEPPACSPLDCEGCCRGDECVEGTSSSACGSGGLACAVCDDGAACGPSGGRMQCVTHCGPDTCGGCCDATGRCITDTDASRCGAGGAACGACDSGETCSPSGCVSIACAESCDGCCLPDGTCDRGLYDDSCGWAGEACVHCAAGTTCDQGCRPFVGVDTCDGCYRDGVCHDGRADDTCGDGADTCHDCSALSLVCASSLEGRYCNVDLEQRYDVYLLSTDVGATDRVYDAFGGLPDLYVVARRFYPNTGHPDDTIDDATTSSPTIDDTLTADWGRFLLFEDVTAAQIMNVHIDILDEDVSYPDPVAYCFIHFGEDEPRLIERLLVNEEIYDCRDEINPVPGQVLRLQFARR